MYKKKDPFFALLTRQFFFTSIEFRSLNVYLYICLVPSAQNPTINHLYGLTKIGLKFF